jgi:hypothetical protein
VILAAFGAIAIRFNAAHKEREQSLYDQAIRERQLGASSAMLMPKTTVGAE